MIHRTQPPSAPLARALATAALLAGTALAGQTPAAVPGSEPGARGPDETLEAAETLEEGVALRVVELERGGFLRARTRRLADGRWQWFAEGAWVDLPGVARATPEHTLLARAADLAREVQGEPVRRVFLADWMARQGLDVEALRELDRVLEEDPRQPDALRLLAAPPPALDVYARRGSPAELFQAAAQGSPALRELALARLAELESPAALFERLRAGLESGSARTRGAAARGLGRSFPGEALEGLLVRSVLDGSEDVRAQAALALGRAGEPAVILPLVRSLGSAHGAVRANAIAALGRTGYPAAVPPLMTYLTTVQSGGAPRAPAANIFVGRQVAFVQDFDVEVASGAAVADPQVGVLTEGSVLDVRVQGVTVQTAAVEGRHLRTALGRLTGASPGSTNSAWLRWWDEHRGDWH